MSNLKNNYNHDQDFSLFFFKTSERHINPFAGVATSGKLSFLKLCRRLTLENFAKYSLEQKMVAKVKKLTVFGVPV